MLLAKLETVAPLGPYSYDVMMHSLVMDVGFSMSSIVFSFASGCCAAASMSYRPRPKIAVKASVLVIIFPCMMILLFFKLLSLFPAHDDKH